MTLEELVKRQWNMCNFDPLTCDIDKKLLQAKLKQIKARKKMQANF